MNCLQETNRDNDMKTPRINGIKIMIEDFNYLSQNWRYTEADSKGHGNIGIIGTLNKNG